MEEITNTEEKLHIKISQCFFEWVNRRTTVLVSNNSENEEKCSICLKCYEMAECVFVSPCRHLFHFSCIVNWVRIKPTCPVCRTDFMNSFEHYYDSKVSFTPNYMCITPYSLIRDTEVYHTEEIERNNENKNSELYDYFKQCLLFLIGVLIVRTTHYMIISILE